MDRNRSVLHGRVSRYTSIVIVLLLFGAPALAIDPAKKASLDAFLARVQRESGTPGVSAAVAVDGHIVYRGAAGHADLQNLVPQSTQTVHNIGSISKIVAAVAILQLVEQGRVDLDAPLREYVPYYPVKLEVGGRERSPEPYRITLRHVLTHTSGIRHYREGEFGVYSHLRMVQYKEFEDAIEFWKDDPLLFAPGEYWSYSSHASNLMHGVVETVAGVAFEQYLLEHVWLPAGMLATQFDVPSRIIAKRGRGYTRDERGKLVHALDENVSYKYAGGGILSSVEDLCRFAVAINEGRLLKPETVKLMWTNQFPDGIEVWSRREEKSPEKRVLSPNQCLSWRQHVDSAGEHLVRSHRFGARHADGTDQLSESPSRHRGARKLARLPAERGTSRSRSCVSPTAVRAPCVHGRVS